MKKIKAAPFLWIAFLFVTLSGVQAPAFQTPWNWEGRWKIQKSETRFTVEHPMHFSSASSQGLTGQIICTQDPSEAVPCTLQFQLLSSSFATNDPDFSNDIKKTIQSSLYPKLEVYGKAQKITAKGSQFSMPVTLTINWRDHTRTFQAVEVLITRGFKNAQVTADFSFNLKDFALAAPKLLGLPIKEEIKIHLEAELLRTGLNEQI